jgi:hypothetical protein
MSQDVPKAWRPDAAKDPLPAPVGRSPGDAAHPALAPSPSSRSGRSLPATQAADAEALDDVPGTQV